MQTNAIPSTVSFYASAPAKAAPSGTAQVELPPPPPAPHFVPLRQEDMNLRDMTARMMKMALGSQVDLLV